MISPEKAMVISHSYVNLPEVRSQWSFHEIPQKKHINPLKFGFSTAPGVGNHRSGAVGHPLRHCAGSRLQRGPGEFAAAQQTPGEAELEELVVQHPEPKNRW